MPTYQILFTDDKGFLLAEDEFVAEHDGAAALVAKWLFDACSDLYANYVLLWRAGRRFKHLSKAAALAVKNNREVIRGAQEIALERERILRDSRSAVAMSQRFLAEATKLTTTAEDGRRGGNAPGALGSGRNGAP